MLCEVPREDSWSCERNHAEPCQTQPHQDGDYLSDSSTPRMTCKGGSSFNVAFEELDNVFSNFLFDTLGRREHAAVHIEATLEFMCFEANISTVRNPVHEIVGPGYHDMQLVSFIEKKTPIAANAERIAISRLVGFEAEGVKFSVYLFVVHTAPTPAIGKDIQNSLDPH